LRRDGIGSETRAVQPSQEEHVMLNKVVTRQIPKLSLSASIRSRTRQLALVAGVACALALSTSDRATAQAPSDGRPCSEATLRGSFGFTVSGTRGTGPTTTEQFVGVGVRTYDGSGRFTDVASLHGQVLPVVRGIGTNGFREGIYVVNPDCTGTSTLYPPAPFPPIESDFVIVNNGKTVREAVMLPQPNIVTAILERQ
jgi:hypothetical protein